MNGVFAIHTLAFFVSMCPAQTSILLSLSMKDSNSCSGLLSDSV